MNSTAEELYHAGCNLSDTEWDSSIRDELVATGDAVWLHEAGENWPDARYTVAIRDALINTGDALWLCRAGCFWPDGRYTEEIGWAFGKTGHEEYIALALSGPKPWAEERRKDIRGIQKS